MSGLFDELSWRGLVHTVSDASLPALLDQGGLVAYIGFDPTADSLHIGNLLQLCNLRRLQEGGHQVIGLAGGATGMIGDPGGRSDERNLLSSDELAHNLAGIRAQIERMLLPGAEFADNADWTRDLTVLDFLRDVGKHFTVNQMIAKESVRSRLERPEQGISFTEFTYMLLQAMDFLHLFETRGCRLQMGASDQWGNITMGVELIRKVRGETAYGLVSPLVLRADGEKMGKSVSGTVWLDADKTTPFDLEQYFLRVEDTIVGTYLRYFTWLSRDEIDELDEATRTCPEERRAQRALATAIVELVHGKSGTEVPETTFAAPIGIVDALFETGLCDSKSDARRQLAQGAVKVDGEKVSDPDAVLGGDGRSVVVQRGKSRRHRVMFTSG